MPPGTGVGKNYIKNQNAKMMRLLRPKRHVNNWIAGLIGSFSGGGGLSLLASVFAFGIDSLSLAGANNKDGFERRQGNPYHGYVRAGFNFVGTFCFRDFTGMRVPDFRLHTAP